MRNNRGMTPEKIKKLISTYAFNGCASYSIFNQNGYHGVIPEQLAMLRKFLHGNIYGEVSQDLLKNEE